MEFIHPWVEVYHFSTYKFLKLIFNKDDYVHNKRSITDSPTEKNAYIRCILHRSEKSVLKIHQIAAEKTRFPDGRYKL